VLTALEKLLLGLWLLPVVLGLVVGVRTGGDEGCVMLFVTGVVALMYVVVLAGTLHHARRRLRTAAGIPDLGAPPDEGAASDEATAGAPGRSGALVLDLPLFLVVPAAVRIVVQEGVWTVVVITGLLVTVLSMAAHVHARGAERPPPAGP
jgi:hypothetical protein